MIRDCIIKVTGGESLSTDEASAAMDCIMDGEATPAQIAGLIIALKQRGETAKEVAGFVRSMRAHSTKIELDDPDAADLVGTGGDGAHTFNVSTASALVAAAAGVTVAKHGNRSVSSHCGSADILEATGGHINPGPEKVQSNINEIGFGFMFAPRFHPAMKHAVGPRRDLGVRTVFNILGPMTNPASVTRQVTGVYSPGIMALVAEVLEMTGSVHALVAHSRDGLDEFSVCAPTDYIEIRDGRRKEETLSPEDCGLRQYPSGALSGGNPEYNKNLLNEVLRGEKSAYRDAVLLNAGALLYTGNKTKTIVDGVDLTTKAIDSGAAADLLARWCRLSHP
ncbi:MAG: anthranilate phosphoribosyltransferase [candidate division Zixibacteria bacterium]|nr:anthranilate phosphoribosyltransferase [candidate division Zixibacteria bacterium]